MITDWEFPSLAMAANQEIVPERRRCLRQMVHAPAFASFDGVSGGVILDLREGGVLMQMGLDLSPSGHVETTGYIAWADALGRAGVRFSDLPEAARRRLNEWLTVN